MSNFDFFADRYFPQDGEDMSKQATISCGSSVNLYANPEAMFFTVTLTAFGVCCKPVNCGDWAKMLVKKKKDNRNLDLELNFGDGKYFGCLRLSCGHRGILEVYFTYVSICIPNTILIFKS
jgi:hypothetical protein